MSTGNIVDDHRYNVVTDSGPGVAGDFYSRVWNGSDDPVKHKAWNPYVTSLTKFVYPVITYELANKPGQVFTGTYLNTFGGVFDAFPGYFDYNDNLTLLNRLEKEVKGHSFNVGVFLAEAPEAASMFVDRCKRIASALRYLSIGRVGKAWRALTDNTARGGVIPQHTLRRTLEIRDSRSQAGFSERMSAMWLELQYGWKPLLSDLEEAAISVYAVTNRPMVCHVKASLKKWGVDTYGSLNIGARRNWVVRKWDLEYLEDFSPQEQLGLTDLSSVLWEKLPWSFVADWFIPVGDYLQARHFCNAIKVSRVLQTDYLIRSFKVSPDDSWIPHGSTMIRVLSGVYAQTQLTVSRSILSSLPLSPPEFKSMEDALSLKHLKNAAALLITTVASIKNSDGRSLGRKILRLGSRPGNF
jgi:hypothetical protein